MGRNFTVSRITAAVFAVAALWLAPQTAAALTITHNGFSTGGVVTAASDDVNVGLGDLDANAPNSGLVTTCGNLDACLSKIWFGGSQTASHAMTVQPDGSTLDFIEYVGNLTGVPWSDYHIEVAGGDIHDFEFFFVLVDENLDLLDLTTVGATAQQMGNSLWFFFDEPFDSTDTPNPNELLLFGIYLGIENIPVQPLQGPVEITQHPSLPVGEPGALALFGLGLAGFGWVRRRWAA